MLAAACIIKCIKNKIPVPKGFVSFYGLFFGKPCQPSWFLTLMDPLLPLSFCKEIGKAYLKYEAFNISSSGFEYELRNPEDYCIAPLMATDEILMNFPRTCFISTILDPLCDQAVEFGKLLRRNGVETDVEILSGLGHGFLYFTQV